MVPKQTQMTKWFIWIVGLASFWPKPDVFKIKIKNSGQMNGFWRSSLEISRILRAKKSLKIRAIPQKAPPLCFEHKNRFSTILKHDESRSLSFDHDLNF